VWLSSHLLRLQYDRVNKFDAADTAVVKAANEALIAKFSFPLAANV
jgi:hypothetical protein